MSYVKHGIIVLQKIRHRIAMWLSKPHPPHVGILLSELKKRLKQILISTHGTIIRSNWEQCIFSLKNVLPVSNIKFGPKGIVRSVSQLHPISCHFCLTFLMDTLSRTEEERSSKWGQSPCRLLRDSVLPWNEGIIRKPWGCLDMSSDQDHKAQICVCSSCFQRELVGMRRRNL